MASSSQPSKQRPSADAASDNANPASSRTTGTHNDEMPSTAELLEIGAKSLQAGAVTGTIGTVFGAGSGIVRGAPPALFALVAGLQWFSLGSTYTASKNLLWYAWGGEENLSKSDHVKASGIAGGVSGMVGGMFRGPKNILPGILFFSMLGAGSSFVSQLAKNSESKESKAKASWLNSKWSPMRSLSDKEYVEMLEEKILRLDAEIAVIDENIASLKISGGSKDNSTTTKTG
ncbi:hypothetical protein DL769_007621 [Monosporascus sp. CRB-8-3]|nr:hypothetical protein DL769_007621 [Monosporascus sp. CRB-8-3]